MCYGRRRFTANRERSRVHVQSAPRQTCAAENRRSTLLRFGCAGGLTSAGAEGSLANGLGYRNSQRWPEALRSHPAKPDGIYYPARYDPALTSCALYDHCQPFVEVVENCGTWAGQPILEVSSTTISSGLICDSDGCR